MKNRKREKRAGVPQVTKRPQPDEASAPTVPKVNCSFDSMASLEMLEPNPRNPNQHPESQIALLAKAILHQGWRSPIVVSKRSGLIVAGHGRYEAAKLLGLSKVPIDYQEFASDEDEYAHLVADNRLAELSETDERKLFQLLLDFTTSEMDTEIAGFDAAALEKALEKPKEVEAPAAFPEVNETLATEYQCPKCQYAWSGKAA